MNYLICAITLEKVGLINIDMALHKDKSLCLLLDGISAHSSASRKKTLPLFFRPMCEIVISRKRFKRVLHIRAQSHGPPDVVQMGASLFKNALAYACRLHWP